MKRTSGPMASPWKHRTIEDGCFNADPHPGNILLLEDGQTLGLIDFGQVMYLPQAAWLRGPGCPNLPGGQGVCHTLVRPTEDFRLKLARLIVALADRKPEEVARYESPMAEIEGTAV